MSLKYEPASEQRWRESGPRDMGRRCSSALISISISTSFIISSSKPPALCSLIIQNARKKRPPSVSYLIRNTRNALQHIDRHDDFLSLCGRGGGRVGHGEEALERLEKLASSLLLSSLELSDTKVYAP